MLKVQRSISVIVAAALLVLVAAGAAVILWSWLSGQAGSLPQTPAPLMSGRPLIEAVKVGPGFVDVIASCVGGECGVASIVLTEPATGTAVAFYRPPEALRLSSEPRDIVVPLMALNASRVAESVLLVLTTTNGVESAYQVSLEGLWGSASTWVGLVAARDVSCALGDLDVDPARIHWVYINFVSGEYRLRYVDGSTVRDASGRARVFTSNNILNLTAMSWNERYSLGPLVVFLNPYRAARAYRVVVHTLGGYNVVLYMPQLVSDPSEVAVDALLLWEDLWWPGTWASLDNYIDHVVRVTIFLNGTVRLEVVRASGCYLHMLLYRHSGLPPFDSIPQIVSSYQSSNHTLPPEAGVLYVKSHGAWVPASDMDRRIWDPVRQRWIETWPYIILVRP